MPSINTVLGPIDSSDLGYTLSHEHVIHCRIYRYLPFLYDTEATIRKGISALKEAKAGVDVELQALGVD